LCYLSTAVAFGQKAFNQLTFTRGQKLEVVTNMNVSAESLMGPSSGTITIADTYTVNDAKANAFTLVKVPKQIKMNFTMGSQEMKVDSDNPNDLNGMLGQPVKEIMSQKPEFTIDALGKIISVKKDKTKDTDEEGAAAGMMGMMLPGMDLSSAVPQEGNPSLFQVLPNHEVKIGDSWTDSINIEGNQNLTTYLVKDINDKDVVLDYKGRGKTITSKEAMGMKVDVNADNRTTGSIVIDKASGIIKQKTSTNTTETTMNLGGREMTSTIKTTMVTNVKPL
ncbi:MAG TPA: DUF6263 family protein, partial [Flavisolibacter sp.]|nr:DUF6263 family protein [Flavisolibacter sp.]